MTYLQTYPHYPQLHLIHRTYDRGLAWHSARYLRRRAN